MTYIPNNTPPKHIQKLINSSCSDYKNKTIFENELYEVVSTEHYYALYDKKEPRYKYRDTYVTLRDCKKDFAIKIAEGLTVLAVSKSNNV